MASFHVEHGRWVIRWRDENGRVRKHRSRFRGNANGRKDAEKLAAAKELEAERRKHGLIDPQVDSAKRPLGDHVDDFERFFRSGEPTKRYADRQMRRLRRMLRGMNAARIADLTESRALLALEELRTTGVPDRWLTDQELSDESNGTRARRERPLERKTRDDYLATLRHFTGWMVEKGRMPADPLRSIPRLTDKRRPEATASFARRAMTQDEIERFLHAAEHRALANKLKRSPNTSAAVQAEIRFASQTRAMFFRVCLVIGSRVNQLSKVRWHDLDLEKGRLRLHARHAKNRTEVTVELPGWLVKQLTTWRQQVAFATGSAPTGEDLVFETVSARKLVDHFRKDLEFAEIPIENHAGRLDCHALRTTAVTQAALAGVDRRVAAKLFNVGAATMDKHYTKLDGSVMKAAAEQLPEPACRPVFAQGG